MLRSHRWQRASAVAYRSTIAISRSPRGGNGEIKTDAQVDCRLKREAPKLLEREVDLMRLVVRVIVLVLVSLLFQ